MRHIIKKILKEETNKFELVKNLIYTMFDNVSFIEYVTKRNEVMIYYTNRDNRQMLIPTEICDMITKYTGLDVVPWHEDREHDNQPDFYIDTEEYEEELNENIKETPKEIERNLNVIRTIIKQVSWDGLCDIWVEYNKMDGEYEIRSKYTNLDFDIDNTQKELEFLDSIIRSMGIRVYIYTPWFVDSCEDEPKFINESKKESTKELITTVLNTIVLPEYEHVICGFEVKEPHERFDTLGNTRFQFISVTITFIGGKGTKLWPVTMGVRDMYDKVIDEVWDVIYNYTNEAVDVYYKTVKDCGNKNIYLRESKEPEPKYLSLIKELIEPLKDEDGVCDIDVSYDDDDDMYTVYLAIDSGEMNKKFIYVPSLNNHISKLRENIKNTIKQYIPIDNLYVGSYGVPNCEWDPISK